MGILQIIKIATTVLGFLATLVPKIIGLFN